MYQVGTQTHDRVDRAHGYIYIPSSLHLVYALLQPWLPRLLAQDTMLLPAGGQATNPKDPSDTPSPWLRTPEGARAPDAHTLPL